MVSGARLMPQLPVTTVVTPWLALAAISGVANSARSSWVCTSIKPGATTIPDTSTSRAPCARSTAPIAAIRSPAIATSARNRTRPLPSITSPPRKIQSVIRSPSKPSHARCLRCFCSKSAASHRHPPIPSLADPPRLGPRLPHRSSENTPETWRHYEPPDAIRQLQRASGGCNPPSGPLSRCRPFHPAGSLNGRSHIRPIHSRRRWIASALRLLDPRFRGGDGGVSISARKVSNLSSRTGSSVRSRWCPPRTPRGAWPALSCWHWR